MPKRAPLATASVDSSVAVYADCEMPTTGPSVEPMKIEMACADNGFGVEHLLWTNWTAGRATGSGTTWFKECKPNCAEGRISYTPNVQVALSRPVRDAGGRLVWSQITFSQLPPGYPAGPQPLPTHPG